MKRIFLFLFIAIISFSNAQEKILKATLKDKIKGGWAGQTIGVSYGGSTEFNFLGTMINDYQRIPWCDTLCLYYYKYAAGLYDDLYMDLTFVDIFEKYGLDAPVDSFANAFAHADYVLWHANQAARYNILNGIKPPLSGYWRNNPHADCIDFQIESDFAGLMSPAMPNAASSIADKIGHIMNYGDGWYGGVFVANMYSLAFISDSIEYIVKEALKSIPQESAFYKCINDVIKWHDANPDDWKSTWFEVQKKWSDEVGCPDGVFKALDIDAKINAAYIVIGLLFGDGDLEKTLEISTRCGQDSDCNPSNAAGILCTILGYNKIPDKWKNPLKPVEDINFKYTTISLNTVYEIGYKQAIKNIEKNGGIINNDYVSINYVSPKPVRFEKCFLNLFPVERKKIKWNPNKSNEWDIEFEGTGFVITSPFPEMNMAANDYIAKLQVIIDSTDINNISLPANFRRRKTEVYWNYELPKAKHNVKVILLNPDANNYVKLSEAIIYSDKYEK